MWHHFKPIFFKRFRPRTGLANIFMARAQISDNFRRNTFACGKSEFTNTIFSDYFSDW
jgi:hypothetical protein